MVGLHDRHARHNEVFGLKRGRPGSKAKHKPVKEYYRDLAKLERRLSEKAEQVEMVPELIEVIGVLAESIEGLDPPNRQLARLAKLASRLAQKVRGVPPNPPWFGDGEAADAARNRPLGPVPFLLLRGSRGLPGFTET